VSDEIQYLSARADGRFEGKEPKRWREVPKALSNNWHEAGYLEEVYSEFLEILERREVMQCTPAELFGSELGTSGKTRSSIRCTLILVVLECRLMTRNNEFDGRNVKNGNNVCPPWG